MKDRLILSFLLSLMVLILSGCSTTRKTMQNDLSQVTESHNTTQADSSLNKSEATLTQSNINENINAMVEFTRVEFSDGTTYDEVFPNRENMLNLWRIRNREQNDPPDSLSKNSTAPGIKSITTGIIDLNKSTQEQTETQTNENTHQQSSLKSEDNKTSNITEATKSTEKERHGFFYWVGVIFTGIIGIVLLYGLYRVFSTLSKKT